MRRLLLLITLCMALLAFPGEGLCDTAQKRPAKTAAKKPAPKKKRTVKKVPAKRETSAAAKQRQQAVNREIVNTQKQIEQNDLAVSAGVATLQMLEHDVAVQRSRVQELDSRAVSLQKNVESCTAAIEASEQRLALMREQYIKAVKRMRGVRKRLNPLAFIFSSKNFYQALRRLRYLKDFSSWRTRREQQIRTEIAAIEKQRARLAASRQELQSTLVSQREAQASLSQKQQEQAATVSRLRADGQALRSLLARKQSEANALSARVSQLIAAETAETEAARRRAEQQRRAAEKQRLEAQQRAAEQARQEAERRAKERETAQTQPQAQAPASSSKAKTTTPPKTKPQKPPKKKQEKKQTPPAPSTPKTPAASKPAPATPAAPLAGKPTASGFAAAKGSLPRPMSGGFSIVSHFGKHPLPNMPEVTYDNPGIDAVGAAGASALAVFAGTVTGLYSLPGYGTVIIVSHGDYYTVYGCIGAPAVGKGDKVKAGQNLGRVMADPEQGGRSKIHFEVWHGREKLNPEAWIR